ncbi:MAG: ABC transporter permease [Ruminococcaceae bacterium]|nr:ABC transporter permease [Oscillospiraceae bacterium]
MLNFAQRNLRIYFRQKAAVFASLLGVFIIVVLYALFLGDAYSFEGAVNPKHLMDTWMIAGIIAITPFTTSIGALGAMVDDKVDGNLGDFYSSPVRRVKIVGGYVLSGLSVGFILSVAAFVLGEAYIVMRGGELLSLFNMLCMLGAILLSVLLSCTMGFLIVCFINSKNAYMIVCTVIGSVTGFLTGVYVPVGQMGENVQWLVKLFPVTHTSVIIRRVMCSQAIEENFAGMDEYAAEYSRMMGISLEFGDWVMPIWVHCVIVTVLAVIFFALATLRVSKEKRR